MQANKRSLRQHMGAIVLGILVGTTTSAQDSQPLEEIVVVGTHLQNQRTIDARRNSDVILDAVTSDEIGRLPDFNVGEALQRLPGIGVQNDQAEARFVTIRALNADYNYTTVDGVSIAVPDRNGRKVFMDVLPASLAERIDVNKTFTPDMEGNAIGGIINLHTASAFSAPDSNFSFNAESGKYELDEGTRQVGPSGTADVSYSNIFGNNDQYGLVVSGNYYRRDSVIPQTEWSTTREFFDASGEAVGSPATNPPYPGNGFAVPRARAAFFYHNTRVRYGATAKLEMKPSDDAIYFIRGFWNKAEDDEERQTDNLEHNGSGDGDPATPDIFNHTSTSGEIRNGSGLFQRHLVGDFDFERTVSQLVGGGDIHYENGGELAFRLNYSRSTFSNFETFRRWEMRGDNDLDGIDDNAFSYVQRGDLYAFTLLDPDAHFNYGNFNFVRDDITDRDFEEDLYEFKLDWSDDMGTSGNWEYSAGIAYRIIDRAWDEDRDRNRPVAGVNTFNLASAGIVQTDRCIQTPGFINGECITTIDVSSLNSALAADMAANPGGYLFDPQTNNDFDEDYQIDEHVVAAYFMFKHSTDRSNLIFGARYEDTTNDGVGFGRVNGGTYQPFNNSGGYDHILPSINYTYNITDDLVLRASFSQSIGRGDFEFIAPVNESLNDTGLTPVLRRSNPELQPRESDNFDIGLDHFFDQGAGLLAANVFYKVVANEIFLGRETIEFDIGNGPENVDVTQPLNNGQDTDILGVEIQAIRNLDAWLPGLGVSANATFLDTNFQLRLSDGSFIEFPQMIGQPDESYNASVFFDGDRLSAKLAYTYQSQKKRRGVRTGVRDVYRLRYEGKEYSLDLKAQYRFSDQWAATLNIWNLTDNGRSESIGFFQELPMVKAEFGRAIFLGVTFNNN